MPVLHKGLQLKVSICSPNNLQDSESEWLSLLKLLELVGEF